jgi:RNA polymerase sigma factor (sigma-70 family)
MAASDSTERRISIFSRRPPNPNWPDARLVGGCLRGDDRAWNALVDKYKNLVYSIVLKYRANQDEAADLFQGVWLDAFNDLPKLRKKSAFKPWLISLTTHKCFHWKKQSQRRLQHETELSDPDLLEEQFSADPQFVEELARNQLVRDAISKLSPRCKEMIRLLFFSFPPMPYQELAEHLGLATGSIGFIRGKCLERLKKQLEKQGL